MSSTENVVRSWLQKNWQNTNVPDDNIFAILSALENSAAVVINELNKIGITVSKGKRVRFETQLMPRLLENIRSTASARIASVIDVKVLPLPEKTALARERYTEATQRLAEQHPISWPTEGRNITNGEVLHNPNFIPSVRECDLLAVEALIRSAKATQKPADIEAALHECYRVIPEYGSQLWTVQNKGEGLDALEYFHRLAGAWGTEYILRICDASMEWIAESGVLELIEDKRITAKIEAALSLWKQIANSPHRNRYLNVQSAFVTTAEAPVVREASRRKLVADGPHGVMVSINSASQGAEATWHKDTRMIILDTAEQAIIDKGYVLLHELVHIGQENAIEFGDPKYRDHTGKEYTKRTQDQKQKVFNIHEEAEAYWTQVTLLDAAIRLLGPSVEECLAFTQSPNVKSIPNLQKFFTLHASAPWNDFFQSPQSFAPFLTKVVENLTRTKKLKIHTFVLREPDGTLTDYEPHE